MENQTHAKKASAPSVSQINAEYVTQVTIYANNVLVLYECLFNRCLNYTCAKITAISPYFGHHIGSCCNFTLLTSLPVGIGKLGCEVFFTCFFLCHWFIWPNHYVAGVRFVRFNVCYVADGIPQPRPVFQLDVRNRTVSIWLNIAHRFFVLNTALVAILLNWRGRVSEEGVYYGLLL